MATASSVVVVAMACRFPEASSLTELWTNVLHGRRSFRQIPGSRLKLDCYDKGIIGESDSITRVSAGLLTNWNFDCDKFRVPHSTYQTTDLTHWLALELASEAVLDLGGVDRLDRDRTAVVIGNTLAGEFSRSSILRLRAPFLDELLEDVVEAENLPRDLSIRIRRGFRLALHNRFPEPNEESLAGGLANTIAGRIANYFDMRAGAYTVDAACASSLVALSDALNLISTDQADFVLVGAVDLSLDPFELVGFSRNGALAPTEMRVFDERANGFWPGEGGAVAIVTTEHRARTQGLPILARVRGCGLSSDGIGGLTRPTSEGQLTACRRAYAAAAVDPADIAYIEAHGTGTAVGDPVEVKALGSLIESAKTPLLVGSIKANIGHTKAAAGFAGMAKVIEALRQGVVPPHVSCITPHPVFAEVDNRVLPALNPTIMDTGKSSLAGVSSFGFGGINAHVVIEAVESRRGHSIVSKPVRPQDAELFLFSGNDISALVTDLDALADRASTLSPSELTDAAAHCAAQLRPGSLRIAVVASDGRELCGRLSEAKAALLNGKEMADPGLTAFVGRPEKTPRAAFLFPGQAAQYRIDGGIWYHRFPEAHRLADAIPFRHDSPARETEVAQPAIVAASLAGLSVLQDCGVLGTVALGHSLGEISALAWAGALSPDAALGLARARGTIMSQHGAAGGAMLRVRAPRSEVSRVISDCALGSSVNVACINGPTEIVCSGPALEIALLEGRCRELDIETTRLNVSHAFHNADMVPAAPLFEAALSVQHFASCSGRIASTITGEILPSGADLKTLLVKQLTSPVLFETALRKVSLDADFMIEVGPGSGLSRLAATDGRLVWPTDAFGLSLVPLLTALAGAFVSGAPVSIAPLFADRDVRPFDWNPDHHFLRNDCGSNRQGTAAVLDRRKVGTKDPLPVLAMPISNTPVAVVSAVVAAETGFDPRKIGKDDRFLDDLHLNSLAVTRIVAASARALGSPIPTAPTEFANSSVQSLTEALVEMRDLGDPNDFSRERIGGVRRWVRCYQMRWTLADLPSNTPFGFDWYLLNLRSVEGGLPFRANGPDTSKLLVWIGSKFGLDEALELVDRTGSAAQNGVIDLAICHDRAPVSSFARSIIRENAFRSVVVIDRNGYSSEDPRIEQVLQASTVRYSEFRLADIGGVERPVFIPVKAACTSARPIGGDDFVVVTGGGKGIAAECALRIAAKGAKVVLVGRTPIDDQRIAAILARACRAPGELRYVQVDVLDVAQLCAALKPLIELFGAATALVHAAAVNVPTRFAALSPEVARRTLEPKSLGLENMIQVLGPSLRWLITFGSIIGRIGLEGETHYSLANSIQTSLTEAWVAQCPNRHALALEWTVWGGLGMAERLGTIERLEAQGVDALSVDEALNTFDQLIDAGTVGTLAVTGRFGPPPDLDLGSTDSPFLRFLDRPLISFPGVEHVFETELTLGRDRYLSDHCVDGQFVFPGAVILEAMAQVSSSLSPLNSLTTLEKVSFRRPLTVPAEGATRVRIAALRSDAGGTELALFAEDDQFAAPCATCHLEGRPISSLPPAKLTTRRSGTPFSATELYGPLFFVGTRFNRLKHYELATSREIVAELREESLTDWFGPYEPNEFVLWDPGVADAAMHAVQAALPHRRLIPVSADSIQLKVPNLKAARVRAVEREAKAGLYTFDIDVETADGEVIQRWRHISFRDIGAAADILSILMKAPDLAVPYLERIVREELGEDEAFIALVTDPAASRDERRHAALRQLGLEDRVERRSDGRPILLDSTDSISIAHTAHSTIAVRAAGPIACDLITTMEAPYDDQAFKLFDAAKMEVRRKAGLRASSHSTPAKLGVLEEVDGLRSILVTLPGPCGPTIAGLARCTVPYDLQISPISAPILERLA